MRDGSRTRQWPLLSPDCTQGELAQAPQSLADLIARPDDMASDTDSDGLRPDNWADSATTALSRRARPALLAAAASAAVAGCPS